MKRNITNLLLFLALLPVTGCSDKMAQEESAPVPINLYATGKDLSAVTKATEIVPFGTTIFASTQSGVYTTLDALYEWKKEANVTKEGYVSFTDNSKPSYPETGGWIYLIAVAPVPQAASIDQSKGTVTYTLSNTPQDILYAKEIRGSRWDNQRFSGNTTPANDKPLVYDHLLTQLKFKAKKVNNTTKSVKVTKISVKGVKNVLSVPLATGKPVCSGSAQLDLTPANGVEVSGTLTAIGPLLLPPLESGSYSITVETSIGTFSDVPITFDKSTPQPFQSGVSHEITLAISDASLEVVTVKVADWGNQTGGSDLPIN
ncbi:fimbrillin family protein [uncultured Parabacteroides sp.]|uniref:fimbrillin family protein n=1 Tax=uncultured Parabacteroides sp. TaxID=512312 RepID=UPI0025EBFE2D|nr:fimbrillin family protein [uncultured Parabacteroides sp.]